MRRIKLIVSYDGTNYCGWQIQDNGITVEEVLNRTLCKLTREEIACIGASRTDSGVHALGNVAVFDTESRIPAEKFSYALNQRLPEDIRIQESTEVAPDWHPRYCNSRKIYEYRILNRKHNLPTERLYTTFFYYPLDAEKMQRAANFLIGEHDFKSFCSSKTQAETTVRTIYDLKVTREGELVKIRIEGNGFLYNMVRIIAGTLINVGSGLCDPEEVERILEAKDRGRAGKKAPASGLTLIRIDYEENKVSS